MTHKTKKLHIAMAGGGTGGHVFPIRSLVDFLKHHPSYRNHIQKLFRFGSRNSLESKVCRELQEGGKEYQTSFVSIFS